MLPAQRQCMSSRASGFLEHTVPSHVTAAQPGQEDFLELQAEAQAVGALHAWGRQACVCRKGGGRLRLSGSPAGAQTRGQGHQGPAPPCLPSWDPGIFQDLFTDHPTGPAGFPLPGLCPSPSSAQVQTLYPRLVSPVFPIYLPHHGLNFLSKA